MARTYNPYANQYEGAINAAGKLGQAFLESTSPAAGIEAEALGWQANRDRQEVIGSQRERALRNGVYDRVMATNPNEFGEGSLGRIVQQSLASAGGLGEYDQIGDYNRAIGGAMPEVSDDRMARLFVGAGDALGQEDAVSLGDRENVRSTIQGNTLQQDRQQQMADMSQAFGVADRQRAGAYDRALIPDNPSQAATRAATGFAMPNPDGAPSQEAAMAYQYGNLDPSGAPIPSGSGGSGGGSGGDDGVNPLDANRWADLGGIVDSRFNLMVESEGAEPGLVDPELRGAFLTEARQRLMQNPEADPRALAAQLWQEFEIEATDPVWGPATLSYTLPQQPQGGGDQGDAPSTGGPQPGTIVDGYRFNGGNPNDPNNWQQVE